MKYKQNSEAVYSPQLHDGDVIDLRELFGVLWAGRWWVILITGLFAVASVLYALSLPNEYKAQAVLAPASSQGGGQLGQLASQFGGLAGLAGVNVGAAETTDVVVAIELMQSWGFVDEFIKKHSLEVPIFAAESWDSGKRQLIFDEDLYSLNDQKWIRTPPRGKTVEPTSWELYREFNERLSISQVAETGLIKVSFVHFSPDFAQSVVSKVIAEVNLVVKEQAQDDAIKNIKYLEAQVQRTPISEMQNVFYSLIEEQTKSKMLADVSDDYVFKYISLAKAPEEKVGPKRVVICLGYIFFGGFISVFIVFFKHLVGRN